MKELWAGWLPYLFGTIISSALIWYDWVAVSELFEAVLRLKLLTVPSLAYFAYLIVLPTLLKSK